MTESELLSLLRNGVKRSSGLIAQITDYHGGPVTTEYILTTDIARELIEKGHQVKIEYLNRYFANGMTIRKSGPLPKGFLRSAEKFHAIKESGPIPETLCPDEV
jgi:hypothetical protein